MGSVVRGLTALVLALPFFPLLAGFPADAAAAASSANSATASESDISHPGWITHLSGARLLSAPPTESTGSGVGYPDAPRGTPTSHGGCDPVRRSSAQVQPSMQTRAGLSSHRATAPPPGFHA